ncbi:MAG: CDGSH iron-sulfur domain-containing protein [Thermoanaerobaculum sp.]
MDKPEVFRKYPEVLELEPGTYFWCACGRSQKQPFCDGSHKGTGFAPVKFELSEKKTVALCLCKHTSTKPFCDGTHKTLG